MKYLTFSALFLALAFADARAAEPVKIIGYFTEWGIYQRNYQVADIPAAKLTHINYAFAKITNGECAVIDNFAAVEKQFPGDKPPDGSHAGNFRQLSLLKEKHPHLKTLISIGGWTESSAFSGVALTDGSRKRFAQSCVKFIKKYGFDGVDIDWEYPVSGGLKTNTTRPEDRRNYTLLLAEIRAALDAQGKADGRRYLLTIAAPAAPAVIANMELDKIHEHIDWLNIMAYDFNGSWSKLTNFNAPLFAAEDDPSPGEERKTFNVDSAVQAYQKAGIPAEKIVVGVPFYGRGWSGVEKANNGLFQKHSGTPPQGSWEAGVFDYKDIAKNYLPKMERHWNEAAKVPWLYDPQKKLLLSYDDPESMKAKAKYISGKKLGGVMIWELSGDTSDNTLLNALTEALVPQKEN